MTKYKFDCGCEVDIIDDKIKEMDGLPSLNINYEELFTNLNYGKWCKPTWELMSKGLTQGIFQLESELGKSWSEKLQPNCMEEICALGALLRPGCLHSLLDGKSLTQHYVDRKHNREPTTYINEVLEPILSASYGILTYQEQTMQIARELAGFDEQEADVLRKGIGKKKPEIIAALKKPFLDGVEKVGLISKEEGEEIFGWIEKSNRYSFNKSHSYSYSMLGYMSAFVKYHFPLHFFCSWLTYAKYKQKPQKHRRELIMEAKRFDITTNPPSIHTIFNQDCDVCIYKDNLYLGIKCIKKIAQTTLDKFLNKIKEAEKLVGKPICDWSWFEFLAHIAVNVGSTVVNNLICCGVLSHWGIGRQQMLYEYEIFSSLNDREIKTVLEIGSNSLKDSLVKLSIRDKKSGGPFTELRRNKILDLIKMLDNPPHSLDDSPRWILTQEQSLMGTPLTFSKIDTIPSDYVVNTTCKEFCDGKNGDNLSLAIEITNVRDWEIKTGKNIGDIMCFVKGEDSTGTIDCVMFNNVREENAHLLYDGNTTVIVGTRSKKGSFLIQKIFQI